MRYSIPLVAALAATVSANSSEEKGETKLFTLETAPGETVEVTEDEKFQMIDVSGQITLTNWSINLFTTRTISTSSISQNGRTTSLPMPA